MSKKLKLVLMVSLLLNVLLVGFVAGRLAPFDFKKYHEHRQAVLKQLPDEKRAIVEVAFKEHRKGMKQHFKERHHARKMMGKILRDEPFDEAAFLALSEKMQRDSQQMRQLMQMKIVELARQLNQKERGLLVEMLRKPRHGRGGSGHHGGDVPPPPTEVSTPPLD